jgi:hypothetical protein
MEPTIAQSGALYALQHGATRKYRRVRSRRVGADLIRVLPTLTTTWMEKLATRPIPAEETQLALQDNQAQVADAFREYRVAA